MPRYNVIGTSSDIRIYINEMLHFWVNKKELVSIHSWYNPTTPEERESGAFTNYKYIIEFTTKTQVIRTEYDQQDKWEEILKLLEKHL